MDSNWIFGYGSLIWRADFPFAEKRPAFINGWQRRFWQGSTDHRGVPGAPGRVVTLISAPEARCWGMAYRLDDEDRADVMDHLDYREKGGYERLILPIHFGDDDAVTGLTYHATDDNPNYLGEATSEAIADQVMTSTGPSGHNVEYILNLHEALLAIGADDDHVAEVARRLAT